MRIESVWDYPRPPRLEHCEHRVRIEFGDQVIVDNTNALRVLETSHPPTYYIPPSDVRIAMLIPTARHSWCEWKSRAQYWTLRLGDLESTKAAWSYAEPTAAFAQLRDFLAFYASRVGACFVGEEEVLRQDGDFYGGWITSNLRGPFKGAPGTLGW